MRVHIILLWLGGFSVVAAPLSLPIPREIDTTNNPSHQNNMKRDAMLFLIGAFVDPGEMGWQFERERLLVDASALPDLVARALAPAGSESDPNVTFRILLSFQSQGFYNDARAIRHRSFVPPPTVLELARAVGFLDGASSLWSKQIITVSPAKGKMRILFRSRPGTVTLTFPNGMPEISVAQTHDSQSGDESTAVRETEIIVKRDAPSMDHDFYTYDSQGRLATASMFYNSASQHDVVGASPYTCMTCHYDSERRRFQREPLSFAPRP